MAEKQPATAEPAVPSASVADGSRLNWRKWLSVKWLIALVAVSIGLHFVGYGYYKRTIFELSEPGAPEISLGHFRFEQRNGEDQPIRGARFQVHVSLLGEVDGPARGRLAARRFKVQQGVEELLRQAHSADFEDPNLSELKRLLQERVNEAIGLRAVSEVIITDLEVVRSDMASPFEPAEETAVRPGEMHRRPNVSQREIAPLPFES